MAVANICKDIYEDEKISVEDLTSENLPCVAKVLHVADDVQETNDLLAKRLLITRVCKERFVHIKVLPFYDNAEKQVEVGAECVLEHETHVGEEFLLPLNFKGKVRLARRPGRRGRYLLIKHVIADMPSFVIVETDTNARLLHETNKSVTISAKSILELKRIYNKGKNNKVHLECTDGVTSYEFVEDDEVNWTVFEKQEYFNLAELTGTCMLPKVIVFNKVNPESIIMKDDTFRSVALTIVDGPIEVIGFVDMRYLVGWVRYNRRKSYETVLFPECLWNKIYIQRRRFTDASAKHLYIKRKYGSCYATELFSTSLYLMSTTRNEVTWLRSPDLFRRDLLKDANKLYEVVGIPFEDSSSDNDEEEKDVHIYDDIEDVPPPLLPRVPLKPSGKGPVSKATPPGILKRIKSFVLRVPQKERLPSGFQRGSNNKTGNQNATVNTQNRSTFQNTVPPVTTRRPSMTREEGEKLKFKETPRLYEIVNYPEPPEEEEKEQPQCSLDIEASKDAENKVLRECQTAEDFYRYSMKEVIFCLECCGLKQLADICKEHKLDGSFFRNFEEWEVFNLALADVELIKKVIHEGWRLQTGKVVMV